MTNTFQHDAPIKTKKVFAATVNRYGIQEKLTIRLLIGDGNEIPQIERCIYIGMKLYRVQSVYQVMERWN